MTYDMKLKHFEEVCIGDAKSAFDKTISDYTAYQEKLLNEHMENAKKQADLQVQAEAEAIRRDTNKELSIYQISVRRTYSEKSEELRGKLFSELRDRLARFMETPAYADLLKNQIKEAQSVAGTEEVHIYIDPSDQDMQNMLSLQTGCDVRISQYSFIGGTRAVIASKNILIDNSFESRLKETEEEFQFALGGVQNGSNR